MAAPKDIIYIDIDEEITGIIDKVRGANEKIVALVLPKRAAMLQSVVNMKLLKRTADQAKKHIVLITSDNNLLPLAGAVGFYTAKTLQTRPVVPPAPSLNDDSPVSVDEEAGLDDNEIDAAAPIGALAGLPMDDEDEIEVDNGLSEAPEEEPLAGASPEAVSKPINKKLKVPNFERFRLMLILGVVLLIALLIGGYVAATALPKANITIKTDTTNINSDITFTASTTAQNIDLSKLIIPAAQKQSVKSDKQQVPATGQQDQGTKASGNVTFSTSCGPNAPTIPAGTQVSAGGLVFITQADTTLSNPSFSGTHCTFSGTGSVQAQNAGDQYNLSARAYTVNGYSGVSAQGSNMSGGTSKIVKIVQQSDIDGAKQKLLDADSTAAAADLKQQFQTDSGIALSETFANSPPAVTSDANAGDQADQVTVSINVTYTMVGIRKENLGQLIDNDIQKRIDTNKQKISNNGIDQVTVKVLDKSKSTLLKVESQTTASAGAEQNADAIRQLVAGKKSGDAKADIQARPGIQDVTIKLSPFWVSSVPKKASRVTVTFQSANGR